MSTGNPTEWNWEFSNGTLSSAQNPTVSFNSPGVYSVRLIVRNANGIDDIERVNYITVSPSPIADFNADLKLACVPATVTFDDLSSTPTGNIVKWEWEFGDGETSTARNPTHIYKTTGFYTVLLRVTNDQGCSRRIAKSRYIRVVDGVNTNFNFAQSGSCRAPFAVNFNNQSSGPGTIAYTWNFGNGQSSTATNPTAIFNAPGTYTVRLRALSNLGCGGDTTKTITLTQTTTDFQAPASACQDQPVSFTNNSSDFPNKSFWDFGDGTTSSQANPVKTYLAPGTYSVRLINTYDNCTDSVRKTITVIDKPAVDFRSNDSSSCQAPFTVQFTDLTPGATTWLWDFGDGNTSTEKNPSHTYTAFGNYTVSLTAGTSADCGNTMVKSDFIQVQETTVSLGPGGGCIPFTYSPIANISTIDSIATYLWNFGDGGTSTAKEPTHNYATAGNYNVTLTITTVGGCTKTATTTIRTGIEPVVSFTFAPDSVCASQAVTFQGSATTTPGAEVRYTWSFGDETSGTGIIANHVFKDTGNLIVRLTVSNNGCEQFTEREVYILPPVAKFDYAVDCAAGTATKNVRFTNESLFNPALGVTHLWEFGDPANSTSSAFSPTFAYAPGRYTVKLTVTNGPCSYTEQKTIDVVDELADFSINKTPVCRNETFTLTAINSNPDNIVKYGWTIGTNGISTAGPTLNYQLSTNGVYDVRLAITDINGCVRTKRVTQFITVQGSTADLDVAAPGACLNKSVTFVDRSTTSTSIVNWEFDFGDGTKQNFTAPPFTHTYTRASRFRVIMKITDATGCTSADTIPLLRVTNPIAGFLADTVYCPASPLLFSDTSSGAGLKYLWNFGDGATSTLQNPTHNYPVGDASYTVKLTVTDISGCQDSVTKTDYIKIRSPKAAFDIRDTASFCPPLRTFFTFKGSDYKSFYWDFGDGGRSTLPNPSYFYGNYGHYTPKLYAVGPGGCIDSASATVSVYDPDVATQLNYVVPAGPICNSVNIDFNLVVPSAFKFILYFGDGAADSSQSRSVSHFYSRPGLNSPRLELIDTVSGCSVTIPGRTRINVLGAVPLFGKDKKEFCDRGTVTFKNFTTKNDPIISNVWNFGDNTTSTDLEPSHTYTQPGFYIVTLTVTTQSNCTKSFSDTIRVYRTPAPNITGRDTICVNGAYPYSGAIAIADTAIKWQWNFGNGQSSTQQNNNVLYNTPGNYAIRLTATNAIGCSRDTTKNIYVTPLPTAVAVQNPLTIPAGGGGNLAMTYTGNIIRYTWLPTTRLSCTDCPTPFANPQYDTKYAVQIEDRYGCQNSGEINVVVVCGKENVFIPNTFSPNGDGRNEVFYPKGTGLYRVKSMRVFNRWGEVVFEKKEFPANDPSAGWNGTFKGKPASPDAYIYTMEILCENNAIIPVKGSVTLLR
jgi:gliding motility-associated-like protein